MPASPSKSTSRGYSYKRKKSEEEDTQRKRPATAPQIQILDVDRFTDVQDTQDDNEARDEESSFIDHRNSNAQSSEARGGANMNVPITTSAVEGLDYTNFYYEVVQREGAASTSDIRRASNAGNQDPPAQVSMTQINTGGGAHFETGHFSGGGHAFGSHSVVNNAFTIIQSGNGDQRRLTQVIINLPRAEAMFDDYNNQKKSGPCFEGTRVTLLQEMEDWVTGQDESRMYILSGLAGIGKSTVAYTMASWAANRELLGASFFFSRDDADRDNAKKLFTTIAYQLCVYDEHFAEAIGDTLLTERGSAAATKNPLEQLRTLVLDPLLNIGQTRAQPILLIIDALDECCDDDTHAVIQGLGQLVQGLPSFKVILTTRPQPSFDNLLNKGGQKLFRLQDIEDKIVDDDIRLYLRYNLSLQVVQELYPRRQWCASDEEINALVCAAGRLFIIAATSVRYVMDKLASHPEAQMKKLICASTQDRTPFKDLDHFYTIILRNVVSENCDDDDIVSRYQSVVGAIILVQRPLPVSVLARLLDIDMEEIHAVLDHLQSVIVLGDDDVPRVYHKSFPDYLTDKTRCKDSHLQIKVKIGHEQIAKRCFEIANSHLKYNILGLGTPARFMSNEDGLKEDGITQEQLEEKIPQQLCYACIHWVTHLDATVDATNIESSAIMNGLEKFVNEHVLHWFELLSLISKLDMAHRAIRIAMKLLNLSSNLHQLLSDALRFVSKFYKIINQSALHIYYSALPFSPTNSLLYRQYMKEAEHGICNVEGGLQDWNAFIADLGLGYKVNIDKFSLNSTMVVSHTATHYDRQVYEQGKLKIWDAFTGTPISTISGHEFAISNDFATVASSVDNVITCYNPDGSSPGTMVTTLSTIYDLAISSESDRIAAVLSDGTLCLWKSTNGDLIGTFDGYRWYGLEFCRSGTRLVCSSSLANVVKLLDGISGGFIACLEYGLLEFSFDGTRIASLWEDSGLKLWNSESGGLIAEADVVRGDQHLMELAISANGSLLAVSNRDIVTLWSENCGQLTKIEVLGFSDIIFSIALSSDNLLAICDFSSIKIYNIESRTTFTLASGVYVEHVILSPDGTRLACGSFLFDVHAINTSSPPSRETRAMALSRDCSRLACGFGFDDDTVELWGTSPAMRRIASHRHDKLIMDVAFGPDSRLFASGSDGGTINLWNGGDGSLHGTINHAPKLRTVALSNTVLIAGGRDKVTLWDLDTLSHIHTFEISDKFAHKASISDDGGLAAIAFDDDSVNLFDLTNRTTTYIATLNHSIQSLAFLPDKSHFMVHTINGEFQSFNLVNKWIANEHLLEHLIQLPSTPLWHDVPLHVYQDNHQLVVLCSPPLSHVPLLCVPTDHIVISWALGSSMIALGLDDGRIILLRLRTS